MVPVVRHYMSPCACDCGAGNHDPVSGFCRDCDPVLYCVTGYPDSWFDNESEVALTRVAAKRNLANVVVEVLEATSRPVEISIA
jgi:hypothetical protein